MSDHTTKMGTDHCPVCNYETDSAIPLDDSDAVPMPGDCSICLNCGAYLQYASDMALIELTQAEWDTLSDEAKKALNCAHRIIKERGPIKRNA